MAALGEGTQLGDEEEGYVVDRPYLQWGGIGGRLREVSGEGIGWSIGLELRSLLGCLCRAFRGLFDNTVCESRGLPQRADTFIL